MSFYHLRVLKAHILQPDEKQKVSVSFSVLQQMQVLFLCTYISISVSLKQLTTIYSQIYSSTSNQPQSDLQTV